MDTLSKDNDIVNSPPKEELNEEWLSEHEVDENGEEEIGKTEEMIVEGGMKEKKDEVEDGELLDEPPAEPIPPVPHVPLVSDVAVPPLMPKEVLEHSKEYVVKTREEIGALIKAARANSVPRNFATASFSSKLREKVSKSESRSRSKSPKKTRSKVDTRSPRSESVKRRVTSPTESVKKLQKPDHVENVVSPSKFKNGTDKPS